MVTDPWTTRLDAGPGSSLLAPAVKALPVSAGISGWSYGSPRLGWSPARPAYDFARHDLSANSVVSLALNWIRQNVHAGRIVAGLEKGDGTYDETPNHPLTQLLRRPNPLHSWRATLGATAYCIRRWGYAYWIKVRTRLSDELVEVQWVPNHSIEVIEETELDRQIASGPVRSYRYTAGRFRKDFLPGDVVHFRDGIDPECCYQGLGELRRQVRNAAAVDFGEGLTAAALRNGNAGKVISPREVVGQIVEGSPEENEMRGLANRIAGGLSGEHYGGITSSSLPVDLIDLGLGPEEMALIDILDRPTSMILAALGLNGIVLGVPTRDQSTYENKQQAFRDALLFGILPLQDLIADEIEQQLLPDFGGGTELRVWWDRRNVELEDPTLRVSRAVAARGGPIVSENEARDMIDLPPVEGGELTPAQEAAAATERADAIAAEEDEDYVEELNADEEADATAENEDEDDAAKALVRRKRKGPKGRRAGARKPHDESEHPRGVGGRFRDKPGAGRREQAGHPENRHYRVAGETWDGPELRALRGRIEAAGRADGRDYRISFGLGRTPAEKAAARKADANDRFMVRATEGPKLDESTAGSMTTHSVGGVKWAETIKNPDPTAYDHQKWISRQHNHPNAPVKGGHLDEEHPSERAALKDSRSWADEVARNSTETKVHTPKDLNAFFAGERTRENAETPRNADTWTYNYRVILPRGVDED